MEIKLADLTKQNKNYLRRDIDGGILTEKEEIDYFKTEQYINVIDNLMLGNYNELGVYEIAPDIVVELINCRKVVSDNYENILFVNSIKPINVFSTISFAVRITNGESPSFKFASLELLEPIYKANGLFENTQATTLKKISLKNDENFKSEVFRIFNIILKDDDANARTELKEDEKEFEKTLMRKIQLLYIKNKLQEEQQKSAEICYKKNVKELEKTTKGKEILAKSQNDEKILKQFLKSSEKDFKAKNEVLKNNIEQKGLMKGEIAKNILESNASIIKQIVAITSAERNKSVEKQTPKTLENNQKPERKLNHSLGRISTELEEIL